MALTLPPRKAAYTGLELARIVVWVGFRGTSAVRAVAIILAESGGRTRAAARNGPTRGCPNGSVDRGLSQINSCYHSEVSDTCAYDPYCNVSAMWRISDHGRSFGPWSTFNNGAYRQFQRAASEWVANVETAGGVGPAIPPAAAPQGQPATLGQALDWVLGPLNWGPIGWLKSHIKAVMLAGGHYVYGKLRPLIHLLGLGLHAAVVLAKHALHKAEHIYNVLVAHIARTARSLQRWVLIGLRDLERWTRRLMGDVVAWVRRDVWGPLNRAWHGVIDWIHTTVIPFFQRALAALSHALARIRDWLLGLIREVEQWAHRAIAWLLDRVAGAIQWVAKFGARVWWIIDHTWDFLFYVATHPLSWWRDLWEAFVAKGGRWLVGQVVSAVAKEADDVEAWLLRYFGK